MDVWSVSGDNVEYDELLIIETVVTTGVDGPRPSDDSVASDMVAEVPRVVWPGSAASEVGDHVSLLVSAVITDVMLLVEFCDVERCIVEACSLRLVPSVVPIAVSAVVSLCKGLDVEAAVDPPPLNMLPDPALFVPVLLTLVPRLEGLSIVAVVTGSLALLALGTPSCKLVPGVALPLCGWVEADCFDDANVLSELLKMSLPLSCVP